MDFDCCPTESQRAASSIGRLSRECNNYPKAGNALLLEFYVYFSEPSNHGNL